MSKLGFVRWDTTSGSAARYAGRLRLAAATTLYTTCFPPCEGYAFTRRKTRIFWRFRPERQSLSAKQRAKPPGTSGNLDSPGAGRCRPQGGARRCARPKLRHYRPCREAEKEIGNFQNSRSRPGKVQSASNGPRLDAPGLTKNPYGAATERRVVFRFRHTAAILAAPVPAGSRRHGSDLGNDLRDALIGR